MEFFDKSTRNLLAAEAAAGIGHHIALSVVGADRMTGSGYMRAKVAQEGLIVSGGVPYTIVRATQFFEFLETIADAATVDGVVHAPAAKLQPVAGDDVAATLAEIAVGSPANAIIDLAGPEALPMTDFLRRFLDATYDKRTVVEDPEARYFGALLDDRSIVPAGEARIGATTFPEWLSR
jgi:uncharacterized protein YbjT (DUF2867 family)